MSGFASAQAAYDNALPPEPNWGRCEKCGEDQEDHWTGIRVGNRDYTLCPNFDETATYTEQEPPERDPDRERDERFD